MSDRKHPALRFLSVAVALGFMLPILAEGEFGFSLPHSNTYLPSEATAHELEKWLLEDPSTYSNFGLSVDISGNRAIIGIPIDSYDPRRGASVYNRAADGTWVLETTLEIRETPDNDLGDLGTIVAIDDETAVLGNPWADRSRPGAYVFERNDMGEWPVTAELVASDTPEWDQGFGFSMALEGNTLVVGAGFWVDEPGAVYVFERRNNDWVETQKLIASDSHPGNHFGYDIALEGDRMLIGAPRTFGAGGSRFEGAVYEFQRHSGEWTESQKVKASDAIQDGSFGLSVDMEGSLAVVGGRSLSKDEDIDDDDGLLGTAYILRRVSGQWQQLQAIQRHDCYYFGDSFAAKSVELRGDVVFVGEGDYSCDGIWAAGAFHIYKNDHGEWRLHQTITPSDPREWQGFGRTVASDGTFLVASANGDQEAGPFAGAAYLFDISEIVVTAVEVPLDFKPGNPRNVINPKKQGKCWVAVLSSDYFDALQVAPETVALGLGAASPDRYRVKDVNRDRMPDLMLRFRTPEVGFQCGDREVELIGETYAGDSIIGSDSVKIVGCKKLKNGIKKSKKVKKK